MINAAAILQALARLMQHTLTLLHVKPHLQQNKKNIAAFILFCFIAHETTPLYTVVKLVLSIQLRHVRVLHRNLRIHI